jgi:hypothetical protein
MPPPGLTRQRRDRCHPSTNQRGKGREAEFEIGRIE